MKYVKYIDSQVGKIVIIEEEEKIVEIKINTEKLNKEEYLEKETTLLKKAVKQLEEYFTGKRKKFDLPLNPKGTEFMKNVWEALIKIPYGEVKTYKQIAVEVKRPKAVRAVGMANHRNPIPIIIPCHRVIRK